MHACMHAYAKGQYSRKNFISPWIGAKLSKFRPIKPRGGFSISSRKSRISLLSPIDTVLVKKKKKNRRKWRFVFFPSWFNDPHSRKRGEKAVDARWPGWTTFSSHRLSAPPPSPAGSSSPYARLALPWCPNVADSDIMCHSVFLFLFSLPLSFFFPISFLFFLFISFAITTTRNNWNEP